MEHDSRQLNEKDAVATVVEGSALVARNEEVIKYSQSNSHQLVNNNTVLTNNSAHVTTFNNCNGLTFGGVYNIGWSPGSSKQTKAVAKLDESVYRKTPTIKEMLESNEPLSAAYLDCVSANFGLRWREITILLEINQLFVDRMYEDNFEKGGVKEVVFQVLSKYFKDHPANSTVGWLTRYLWNNGFRKTIWTVKGFYKELKKLESEFD